MSQEKKTGRPKKSEQDKMNLIQIRLPPKLLENIDSVLENEPVCLTEGLTGKRSDFLRKAAYMYYAALLDKYLRRTQE